MGNQRGYFEARPRYSETHINRTLNKLEFYINQAFNKIPMEEIFVNLTCVYRMPVYSEQKSWSLRSFSLDRYHCMSYPYWFVIKDQNKLKLAPCQDNPAL